MYLCMSSGGDGVSGRGGGCGCPGSCVGSGVGSGACLNTVSLVKDVGVMILMVALVGVLVIVDGKVEVMWWLLMCWYNKGIVVLVAMLVVKL